MVRVEAGSRVGLPLYRLTFREPRQFAFLHAADEIAAAEEALIRGWTQRLGEPEVDRVAPMDSMPDEYADRVLSEAQAKTLGEMNPGLFAPLTRAG